MKLNRTDGRNDDYRENILIPAKNSRDIFDRDINKGKVPSVHKDFRKEEGYALRAIKTSGKQYRFGSCVEGRVRIHEPQRLHR